MLRAFFLFRVYFLDLFQMGGQLKLVDKVVKIVRKERDYLFIFLENGGFVDSCLLFWNESLEFKFQNEIYWLFLLLGQGIWCWNLLYDIVVFSDDDWDLVLLDSSLVSWIRGSGLSLALRCKCVALGYLWNNELLFFLFWWFLSVFPILLNLSFWTITFLRSFGLFWLFCWKSVHIFSEALSCAHLVLPHEVWKVFE